MVARLHLDKLGVELTTLSPSQYEYLNLVPGEALKPAAYRY